MTPDKARDLLDGTTPGPWFFDDGMDGSIYTIGPIVPSGTELECTTDDAALAAHAPDMAAMIAGMREEWGVKWDDDPNGLPDWGFPTRAAAEQWEKKHRHRGPGRGRIVRRCVTTPEEA